MIAHICMSQERVLVTVNPRSLFADALSRWTSQSTHSAFWGVKADVATLGAVAPVCKRVLQSNAIVRSWLVHEKFDRKFSSQVTNWITWIDKCQCQNSGFVYFFFSCWPRFLSWKTSDRSSEIHLNMLMTAVLIALSMIHHSSAASKVTDNCCCYILSKHWPNHIRKFQNHNENCFW